MGKNSMTQAKPGQSQRVVSSICKITLKVNPYRKKTKKAQGKRRALKRPKLGLNANSPHNTTQYLVDDYQCNNQGSVEGIDEELFFEDIDNGLIPHRLFKLNEEEQLFLFAIGDSMKEDDASTQMESDFTEEKGY